LAVFGIPDTDAPTLLRRLGSLGIPRRGPARRIGLALTSRQRPVDGWWGRHARAGERRAPARRASRPMLPVVYRPRTPKSVYYAW